MPATAQATNSPTFGWDTVFAVPVDRVNKAIATRNSSPAKMDFQSGNANGFQVRADFDPWQLIPEGDGAIVRMALPMRNLVGSYIDTKGQKQTFACPALVGIIEVKLNALPHDGITPLYDANGKPLPPPAAGTDRHLLQVRSVSNDPNDPIVTFVSLVQTKPITPVAYVRDVESAFLTWCTDHLEDFSHIFAVIDLNNTVATGQWAFCKPHTTKYAIVDKIDKSASYLGILCMTSNDPVPTVQQISAFAIPDKCSAAFLISERRLLEDIIKPSLTGVWPSLDANDIEIDSSGQVLSIADGVSIALPDTVTPSGDTYTTTMTSFSIEIVGTELKIDTHIEIEVSPGIYATCTSTYYYSIGLGTNSKGEPALVYNQSRQPVKTEGHRSDPGIQFLNTLLTVITVVLAIAALLVDPAIAIVIGVVLAGVAVGQYEINNLGIAHGGDAPGLGDLRKNFTAPITWTDSKDLTLHSAGVNDSLQLGGVWN